MVADVQGLCRISAAAYRVVTYGEGKCGSDQQGGGRSKALSHHRGGSQGHEVAGPGVARSFRERIDQFGPEHLFLLDR